MLAGCTPWPADLAADYEREGYWAGKTIGELLDAWAGAFADREAVVYGDERITYRELWTRVDRLAAHLLSCGLRPQERLLVQLPNSPEFLYLYFACLKTGVLPVMALPQHRFAEISYLADLSQAVGYAIPETFRGYDFGPLAQRVREHAPSVRLVLTTGHGGGPQRISITDLVTQDPDPASAHALRAVRPDPSDVALFLLSGGTTGLPKLIPRTHNDYAYNSHATGSVSRLDAQSVYLVSLPIGHNFPLASPGIQGVLERGGKVILADVVKPADAFLAIERERVTVSAIVPAQAITWLGSSDLGSFDLSSLQVLQVGGARLPAEVAMRARTVLACQVQQVFGMAEGVINSTRLDDPDEDVLDTQGRPCSSADEFRVVNDHDEDVEPGAAGHLLVRGPYTIRGYYRAPEHNAKAFTADGFYRTGDIVRVNTRGNLIVEGRAKDMINRGGEKISAEEIENVMLAHPSVHQVAVVAMPDPILGERTCAYVIPNDGASLTLPGLVAFLEGHGLAKFKWPERLELCERFPLTNVGKVSKADLREDIAGKLRGQT